MRKKEILGNYVKHPDEKYNYSIKKISTAPEAYTALITFLPGCRKLCFTYDGQPYSLAGEGYKWLMYLPMDEAFCLTTFYDPSGEIIEWYFDISKSNFTDEDGMPCTDDIYLDLVILPSGKTLTVDADELQEALDDGLITREDFDYAYRVHDEILDSKWNDAEYLKRLCGEWLLDYQSL